MTTADQDAVAYVYENVGLPIFDSTDAIAYVYENVGVSQTQKWSAGVLVTTGRNVRDAVAYIYEYVT